MPTATFENLKPEKQDQIFAALINEFSKHRLMEAQVARIIKDCGIARGSFYKYFADLNDSYEYALKRVLTAVHFDILHLIENEPNNSLAAFYEATRAFIDKLSNSKYRDFYRKYVLYNQYELKHTEYDYRHMPSEHLILKVNGHEVSDKETVVVTYKWATKAAHEVIKAVLEGHDATQELQDYQKLLHVLNAGLSK